MPNHRLPAKFFGRKIGETKWPADMDEMVAYWISTRSGYDLEEHGWSLQLTDDLAEEDPDLCIDFIIEVLKRAAPQPVKDQLAPSVLEDLLANHGAAVIDRVEAEARRDPQFRNLLGGVWRYKMTDEIWNRVRRLAPEAC